MYPLREPSYEFLGIPTQPSMDFQFGHVSNFCFTNMRTFTDSDQRVFCFLRGCVVIQFCFTENTLTEVVFHTYELLNCFFMRIMNLIKGNNFRL